MSKDKGLNALLETALVGDSRDNLGSVVKSITTPVSERSVRVKEELVVTRPRAEKVSPAQMKAVADARNSQRGRGKKKENRKMIAFQAPIEIIDEIEYLCFSLGRTKNDLYEEAMVDIIEKYKK